MACLRRQALLPKNEGLSPFFCNGYKKNEELEWSFYCRHLPASWKIFNLTPKTLGVKCDSLQRIS